MFVICLKHFERRVKENLPIVNLTYTERPKTCLKMSVKSILTFSLPHTFTNKRCLLLSLRKKYKRDAPENSKWRKGRYRKVFSGSSFHHYVILLYLHYIDFPFRLTCVEEMSRFNQFRHLGGCWFFKEE